MCVMISLLKAGVLYFFFRFFSIRNVRVSYALDIIQYVLIYICFTSNDINEQRSKQNRQKKGEQNQKKKKQIDIVIEHMICMRA